MNILITGTHGFVGSNLVSALKERHTLYGLDIVSPEKEGVVKTYAWNELASLPEVDTIIHLAGKAHDTKNKSEAQSYFDINTGLTQKIFDHFLQSKAKQFIFFSSVKAAADTVEGDCLTEDVVPKPVGPYGESKIAAEKYIRVHGKRYTVHEEGEADFPCTVNREPCTDKSGGEKRVYIFRPCMIHGPGNKGNLNLLYDFVSKGIPYPLGAFENKRSFLSIRNLTYIVEQFILQNPESGTYHLADDEPISTNELIELIAKSKNRKARIWKINRSLVTLMAKFGTICKLPFNSDRLQKLTENYVVSNQKMKTAIGIERLPVGVKEGLLQTLKTFY